MVIYPYVTYIYIYNLIIIWTYLQDHAQYSHVASSLPSSADEAMSKYLFGAVATCGPWSDALESTLGLEQDVLNGDFLAVIWRFP